MKKTVMLLVLLMAAVAVGARMPHKLTTSATSQKATKPVVAQWPDGTVMDAWFQNITKVDVKLSDKYVLQDFTLDGKPITF